jgi:tetratricopeptide (TPR) repeat protein
VLRNKLLFGGIGVIAILLVASLAAVTASLGRERQARRQAETEEARSRQVTQFLKAMLQGVGPSVARGRDTVMLREILDRTAERIGSEIGNQPTVEAELRSLIGRLYLEIGNYDGAEKMHRAALTLYRKRFGPESPEAAASLNDLGVALWKEWKQPEAEAAHREALAIRRRLYGNEHADVATSLNNLADVYRHYQRPTQAEPLAREALRIRRKRFGNDSLEAADSLRVLSILLGDEDKPAEAEATAREVLAIRRKRIGPEDPLVAASLADVAWAAGKQRKWDEVESLQREALAMQRKLLSDGHPASMDSLHNLCATLEGEGKYADAETFHREALTFWNQRAGREAPQALAQLEALVWMKHLLLHSSGARQAQTSWLSGSISRHVVANGGRLQPMPLLHSNINPSIRVIPWWLRFLSKPITAPHTNNSARGFSQPSPTQPTSTLLTRWRRLASFFLLQK